MTGEPIDSKRPSVYRSAVFGTKTVILGATGGISLAGFATYRFATDSTVSNSDIAWQVLVFLTYATLLTVLIMSLAMLHTIRHANRQSVHAESSMRVAHRLALAIEMRDSTTPGHNDRMGRYCRIVAEEMGLDPSFCVNIELAAPLHDVGKVGVPDRILNKPGPLTPTEREVIEQHVELGAAIIGKPEDPLLMLARSIVLTHHEAWDGSGYPNKLTGSDIPIEGRIAAVADVFDALMSPRPYKEPWPVGQVLDEIMRLSGSKFDPEVVEVVERCLHRFIQVERQPIDDDVSLAIAVEGFGYAEV